MRKLLTIAFAALALAAAAPLAARASIAAPIQGIDTKAPVADQTPAASDIGACYCYRYRYTYYRYRYTYRYYTYRYTWRYTIRYY